MAMQLAVRVRYRRVGRVGGIESLISKREFIVVDALDLDYLASSVFGGHDADRCPMSIGNFNWL